MPDYRLYFLNSTTDAIEDVEIISAMGKFSEEFWAVSAGGQRVRMQVYDDVAPVEPRDRFAATVPGTTSMFTGDGAHVNQRKDGSFEVVATGRIYRRL